MSDFNLNDEYETLLDLLEKFISEMPDEAKHYGVKGMRWGVRKDRSREDLKSLGPDEITRKTSSGETITLKKLPSTRLHRALGRMSKSYTEEYSNHASLKILNSSGKKVGEAEVSKRSNEELNLVWLGIDKSHRGQGYATQAMRAAQVFGEEQGFKKLTLEVPGNSADARHIYTKLGFKVTKEADSKDDIWGGLTEMEYVFDEVKHGRILTHYGVKGMRWGVRKDKDETNTRSKVRRGAMFAGAAVAVAGAVVVSSQMRNNKQAASVEKILSKSNLLNLDASVVAKHTTKMYTSSKQTADLNNETMRFINEIRNASSQTSNSDALDWLN